MLQYKWCKSHYLDASALVKLVADDSDEEPGKKALRDYYWANIASVYATSYSVAETLSAFKGKFLRKKISEVEYLKYQVASRNIGASMYNNITSGNFYKDDSGNWAMRPPF